MSRWKTYFGGFVSRCGDKVCAVRGELNVVDLKVELVGLDVFQLFARLFQSVSESFMPEYRVDIPWHRTG